MINRTTKLFSLLSASALTLTAHAYQALDLNIGDSVGIGYSTNLDQRSFGFYANGLIGLAHDNNVASPGVRYNILPRNDEAFLDSVFVNLSGVYANIGDYDADLFALAFGTGARLKLLDEYSFLEEPLYLSGAINYAPPGLTWDDGENFQSWALRLEYPVFEKSLAYVGWRQITADISNDGEKHPAAGIDKTLFIGIHYVF